MVGTNSEMLDKEETENEKGEMIRKERGGPPNSTFAAPCSIPAREKCVDLPTYVLENWGRIQSRTNALYRFVYYTRYRPAIGRFPFQNGITYPNAVGNNPH